MDQNLQGLFLVGFVFNVGADFGPEPGLGITASDEQFRVLPCRAGVKVTGTQDGVGPARSSDG